MYIYNVTINIDKNIQNEWLIWIEKHIQQVLKTGAFFKAKLTQVLEEQQMSGITYSVQYTAKNKTDLDNYYKNDAPKLRAEGLQKFADKMVTFRTELKVIKEFTHAG